MSSPGQLFLLAVFGTACARGQNPQATIEVDPAAVTGHISPYFFGQFIEHEHNTIQGGLWAELLRDRKFEQGDGDGDGVSNGWVPDEPVHDAYWTLQNHRGPTVPCLIDLHERS